MGIRYWAQWYSIAGPPKYEVYAYVGQDKDKGIFYFKQRKHPFALITKSFYQLNYYGFRPFVLDLTAIENYLEGVAKNGTSVPT